MSGLRERNKAKRREGILDAALELFGTAEIQSVNLDQIAARAEVSLPTIYNLVGTREQLLVALIGRVIEGLVETLSEKASEDDTDPIA
jgi:AcrR family transcriptional regulator